jgi:hypothetical protein
MRYCGRQFSANEIEAIRDIIRSEPKLSRYRISIGVCEKFNWRRPDGKLKDMSCRVALLRMQSDGHITLPIAQCTKPVTYGVHPEIEAAVDAPINIPSITLANLTSEIVVQRGASRLWNAYVQRYHYLGHQLIPGAQLRYFVYSGETIVALLSFGASAWKVKPRDEYIGWSAEQRQRNLHLVVNNARFLILPWIRCDNLASKTLALISRRIARDWQQRYAYRPVLLESFVDDSRYRGTCYKAANWQCLGKTKGRGKLDRHHDNDKPIKSIWTYPLVPEFRHHLTIEA